MTDRCCEWNGRNQEATIALRYAKLIVKGNPSSPPAPKPKRKAEPERDELAELMAAVPLHADYLGASSLATPPVRVTAARRSSPDRLTVQEAAAAFPGGA